MSKSSVLKDFLKGLWEENPVLVLVLGMCPTLAVTNSAVNGFAMGCAASFVLISSSTFVSVFKKFIPDQVRIATYTVLIATFVTLADLFLKAKFPVISKNLGPYVPLIVVNCIILGRAEAFASKNSLARSFSDALGMGVGFTLVLVVLGTIREILGMGSIFGMQILGSGFERWVIMILPSGAFLTLGVLVGLRNVIVQKR